MRYAIKFAYDGTRFAGYARQPGKITVEGEIIKAMKFNGIAKDVRSASRTDRGVSAAVNVIAINTDFNPEGIVGALNSSLESIYFYGIADVSDDFNPRHAKLRWYRYIFLKNSVPPVKDMEKAASMFLGEHDFSQFSKKDSDQGNSVLNIESIEFTVNGEFIYVDIKAHRFLWQLVRRILSAVVSVAEMTLEPNIVEELLAGTGKARHGIKPLPPENLILMDISYDIEFKKSGHPTDYFENRFRELKTRSEAIGQVLEIISS